MTTIKHVINLSYRFTDHKEELTAEAIFQRTKNRGQIGAGQILTGTILFLMACSGALTRAGKTICASLTFGRKAPAIGINQLTKWCTLQMSVEIKCTLVTGCGLKNTLVVTMCALYMPTCMHKNIYTYSILNTHTYVHVHAYVFV